MVPGRPTAAALEAAGADQAALGELGDQRRDRRAGQAELGGERGPRARAVVAQPAQDQAEVGTPQGQLVGTEAPSAASNVRIDATSDRSAV